MQEQVRWKCHNLFEHYVQIHQGTNTFTKPLENIKLHGHVVVFSLVELDVVTLVVGTSIQLVSNDVVFFTKYPFKYLVQSIWMSKKWCHSLSSKHHQSTNKKNPNLLNWCIEDLSDVFLPTFFERRLCQRGLANYNAKSNSHIVPKYAIGLPSTKLTWRGFEHQFQRDHAHYSSSYLTYTQTHVSKRITRYKQ